MLFALLLTCLVSGCGFHPTESQPDIQRIQNQSFYLISNVSRQELIDSPIVDQLYTDMLEFDLSVSKKPDNNQISIVIKNESTSANSLSLSQNLFNRHIELKKTVDYQIIDSQGNILSSLKAQSRRDLYENQTSPSAKTRERQKLMELINKDISQEIISQLTKTIEPSSET